ncbi:MAG TPA: TetR/AcrR family transcriptional regulator [Kribbella sp.]|nr:TetR/AcrR family transcriptional regulator [Kribbella sp.]
MSHAELTDTARDRLIRAAADLLTEGGRDAVSTRAVSAAAGVQAPTLYRLFGDKDGLLDAVAAYGFEQYLADKLALESTGDPVEDLRRGWDLHVEFGLSKPAFYVLMYGDARPGKLSPAAREAAGVLRGMIAEVAAAGRLRMSVERAAQLASAVGRGVVMELISIPPAERDLELSVIARENTLQAILTPVRPDVLWPDEAMVDLPSRAVALRALLDRQPAAGLTEAEQGLLEQWLDRIADAPAPAGQG